LPEAGFGTGAAVSVAAGAKVVLGVRVAVAAGIVAVGTAVFSGVFVAVSVEVAGITVTAVGLLMVSVGSTGDVVVFVRLQANNAKANTSMRGTTNLLVMHYPLFQKR